jgi:hypothetical protein
MVVSRMTTSKAWPVLLPKPLQRAQCGSVNLLTIGLPQADHKDTWMRLAVIFREALIGGDKQSLFAKSNGPQ